MNANVYEVAGEVRLKRCPYCGDAGALRSSNYSTMCVECGNRYNRYIAYKKQLATALEDGTMLTERRWNALRGLVIYYRRQKIMGYEVPTDFR